MESGLLIAGRYRLREPLGRGGMSVVWRADDEVLGREVAIKVLAPQLAADPAVLRRIRDEARAAAGLRHPHVVEVHDYGEWQHQGRTVPFVVMELLEGRSVHDLLSGGALAWRLAVLIGAQMAAALAAAHTRGIVHRDVKPANAMVTASGVKLVDFGISASVGEWENPADEVLGTPAYLAPERIVGGPARPATDVYALGLLLYLALAGRMPWEASTTTQMLTAHTYADPAPLPPVAGLPRAVARLVHRCLAKRPGDRPTAAEVADRLGDLAGLTPNPLLRSAAATVVLPAVSPDTAPMTPPVPRPAGRRLGAGLLPLRPLLARPQSGHPQSGHPQSGHPQPGHPQPGHPQPGHPQPGHPQPGHPQPGHPQSAGPLPARLLPAAGLRGRRAAAAGVAAAALVAGGVATWAATGSEAPRPPSAEAATPEATGCPAGRAGAPTCRPTTSLAGLAAVPIAAARRAAAERAAADRAAAHRASAERAAVHPAGKPLHPDNQSAAGKPAKVGKDKNKNKNKNKK